MNLYASPQRLASVWRRMADTATESGETPLLTLGLDAFYPDSGLSLLALSRIARQNLGPLNPTVIAGGEAWLWLLATLVWRPAARSAVSVSGAGADSGTALTKFGESHSENVDHTPRMVLYAGGDSALHAATLNIAAQQTDSDALPPGLAWSVSPTATPGAERLDFELLPPTLAENSFVPETAALVAVDRLEQAERWAAVLLALGLLVGAFFG